MKLKSIINGLLTIGYILNCNSQNISDQISGIKIDKNYYEGINNINLQALGFVESFHFNDSIKSVTTFFPKIETKNVRLGAEINLKIYPFLEFDKFGSLISIINTGGLNYNIFEDIESIEKLKIGNYDVKNPNAIRKYNYRTDESDIVEKSKYHLKKSTLFPAYDGNKIKLNTYFCHNDNSSKDKTIVNSYIKYKYQYNSNGTINNEIKFMFDRLNVKEVDWKKEVDSKTNNIKKPTYYKTYYSYDDNEKLVCQDIIFDYSDNSSVTSESPFLDGYLSDGANLNYYYDEKERLNEIVFSYPNYKPSLNYLSEKYYYDLNENYIFKVIRSIYKKGYNIEFYYNSLGDIIKVNYVSDVVGQKCYYQNQVYEYEYDKNNNWIKCKIYFEGTNKNEPNFIAERKIEYYSK